MSKSLHLLVNNIMARIANRNNVKSVFGIITIWVMVHGGLLFTAYRTTEVAGWLEFPRLHGLIYSQFAIILFVFASVADYLGVVGTILAAILAAGSAWLHSEYGSTERTSDDASIPRPAFGAAIDRAVMVRRVKFLGSKIPDVLSATVARGFNAIGRIKGLSLTSRHLAIPRAILSHMALPVVKREGLATVFTGHF